MLTSSQTGAALACKETAPPAVISVELLVNGAVVASQAISDTVI